VFFTEAYIYVSPGRGRHKRSLPLTEGWHNGFLSSSAPPWGCVTSGCWASSRRPPRSCWRRRKLRERWVDIHMYIDTHPSVNLRKSTSVLPLPRLCPQGVEEVDLGPCEEAKGSCVPERNCSRIISGAECPEGNVCCKSYRLLVCLLIMQWSLFVWGKCCEERVHVVSICVAFLYRIYMYSSLYV